MSEGSPPNGSGDGRSRDERPKLGPPVDREDRPKLGPPVDRDRERPKLGPPVDREDRPRLGPPRGDRDSRGDRGDRDGPRGRRDDRPRAPQTVKGQLRAKARKKARKQKKKMFQRRKVCRFCADKKLTIDYREPKTLRLFLTETGKLIPSRISGNCAKHQRPLALAVKRARHVALLPFAAGHM